MAVLSRTCFLPRRAFCTAVHIPVLRDNVTRWLSPQRGQLVLDGTFGAGGHSRGLLDACEDLRIVGADRDEAAVRRAEELARNLEPPSQLFPLLARFSELPEEIAKLQIAPGTFDAVMFDLGANSQQLDDPTRGFSVARDGPLDMRMDPTRNPMTAADVINSLGAGDLAQIFKKYGEEPNARRLANAIVERRFSLGPFRSTTELAATAECALGLRFRKDSLGRPAHVATRMFQALRIFVNNELNELMDGLSAAHRLLRPGGLCLVISFHSLEDRLVKREFQSEFGRAWEGIWRGVETADEKEIEDNPRARSAKARLARKR